MTDNASPLAPQAPKPFGDTEDKSLRPADVETKDAETTAPSRVTVPVKMLHHSHNDGEQLIPGHEYELPRNVAEALVANKRAVRL